MKNRKLPIGNHKAYIKNSRIIKRIEKGEEVIRIETTYHLEKYGDYTHYSPVFKEGENKNE